MKRFDILLLLASLALLNSACADESGSSKQNVTVAKNTGTTTTQAASVAMTASAAVKETGTTRSAVNLMAAPYSDAKQTGQLPANATVTILERHGGWMRISAQAKSGWARLYQIRAGEGPEAKNTGGGLAALKNISQTGRSGSQGIVATTGIRGLSAEDLKTAKPNPKAVESMETNRATDSSARDFAHSGGLNDKNVPFLN